MSHIHDPLANPLEVEEEYGLINEIESSAPYDSHNCCSLASGV